MEHDLRITMQKNTNYWNYESVKPDIINFELIDDVNTAMAGILNEDIYFYKTTPPNDRERLIKEGIAKVVPNISLYFTKSTIERSLLMTQELEKQYLWQ